MDYEKAYKESFEAVKGLHDAGNALTKKQMEIVFPRLAESEDERIRKALIWHLKADTDFVSNGVTKTECIAWLEKQKDPHFTKRNALFNKCVENCDPEIMKRVSDEVDKMLEKEQKLYWKPTKTDVALLNKAIITNNTLTSTERKQLDIIRSRFGYCRASNCNGIIQEKPNSAEGSDDERIREDIVALIKFALNDGSAVSPGSCTTKEEALAYLEKQKEAGKAIKAVERIDKYIDEHLANAHDMKDSNPDKKYYRGWDDALGKMAGILQDVYSNGKQKEQEPIKVEVYEVGKGTTICGQDYKCKKDYKEGSCWYIKDVLYHCSRDGYLTDQNGVSWSCTPEWFNEYIYTNNELADEEKNNFVRSQFLQCKRSFDGFKKGEHYWFEYIGDDMYVGRSDNILNQKFHITPRQLYTLFSQQLDEVQGPPQEEKQVSLNYEPPFNENPSDIQIIEALIKHLKEQDGFLTAIDCVSTKAILSWLEKQKEQKHPNGCFTCDEYKKGYEAGRLNGFTAGYNKAMKEVEQKEQKSAEWSEEDENMAYFVNQFLEYHELSDPTAKSCKKWFNNRFKSLRNRVGKEFLQTHWKPSEEQMKALWDAYKGGEEQEPLRELIEQLKKRK